ncbi:MAG: SMC-Scp complex subunit ScpB, partial [Acetobacter syzygii]
MTSTPPPAHPVVPDEAVRLAEALIFASTEPVSSRRLADLLEDRQIMPVGEEDLVAFVAAVLAARVRQNDGRGGFSVEL